MSEVPGAVGGVDFLLKIPGVSLAGGGGGAMGQGGCLRELGGGGLNFFFFGAEIPTKLSFKICSCNARPDLKPKSLRFSLLSSQTTGSASWC